MQDQIARLTSRGLSLDAEELPLLSGGLDYFQVPRAAWGRCLDAVVELGLPLCESSLPWSVHEARGGGFCFEGRSEDGRFERDLGAFLDACQERGLRVILRPGPQVNAELSFFGFPERVLRDERCLARGPSGCHVILPLPPRAFPVPSYASERFLEEAGLWLAAVAGFLAPRAWPAGPVVALQLDHELGYFFRTAAYDQDYHRDAVAAYRRFLGARYPGGLPGSYGEVPLSELEPPRRFELAAIRSPSELVPHLDWLAAKEAAIAGALGRLAEPLRAAGIELPLLASFPASEHGAASGLAAAEEVVGLARLELHLRAEDHAQVKRAARTLAGSSRLPILSGLGCGSSLWWFPRSAAAERSSALAALMHGARGFNLSMLVERDRWYGSPIAVDGGRRHDRFESLRSLLRAFRESRFQSLARSAPVGLLQVREHARLQLASSLLGPVSPLLLSLVGVGPEEICAEELFGLEGGAGREAERFARAAEAALERLRLGFDLIDSELPGERLTRYRLLLCPSLGFADRGLLARLASYVEAGGVLLLCGTRPALDETMSPLAPEALPPHELCALSPSATLPELVTAIEPVLAALAARLGIEAGPGAEHPAVELELHRAEDGSPAVLFLANRGEARVRPGKLQGLAPATTAYDALDGAPVALEGLSLGAHEIRMLRIVDGPAAAAGEGAGER